MCTKVKDILKGNQSQMEKNGVEMSFVFQRIHLHSDSWFDKVVFKGNEKV